MFKYSLFSLFALASGVVGASIRAADAPVPSVTYPHDGTTAVWVIGWAHNVTWDASGDASGTGTITLAKSGVVDSSNVLASNVPLSAGRTEVTVPNVTPASDYTVVLTVDGQSSSSADFTIAESKSSLPAPISGSASGSASASAPVVTTFTSGSSTITSTITDASSSASSAESSIASSASSVASSAEASLSSVASSAEASLSSVASSAAFSLSSAQSSALSSAHSSATGPASSTSARPSQSSGAAGSLKASMDVTPFKFISAAALIALSAGAYIL